MLAIAMLLLFFMLGEWLLVVGHAHYSLVMPFSRRNGHNCTVKVIAERGAGYDLEICCTYHHCGLSKGVVSIFTREKCTVYYDLDGKRVDYIYNFI